MNNLDSADSTRFSVRTMFGFLAAGAVALAGAMVAGIDGNPLGLGLLYLAAVLLVVAIVHHWRRPRRFFWLFLGSLIGFPVFAILHNAFYAFGELSKDLPVLPWIFEGLHVAGFLIAIVVCPAGALVGLIGFIITAVRARRARSD
jgi:hypothetical protein